MILVEDTSVPFAALPIENFKDHMRLGSGFSDEGLQDSVVETSLRSALAAIEARTGKILIQRGFTWTVTGWRDVQRQPLPVAPVSVVIAVSLIDRIGSETPWPGTAWHLEPDTHRPKLVADGVQLPAIPHAGSVKVRMLAGFGPAWSDIPADLGQAVLLLAAHFYEFRYDVAGNASRLPVAVDSLIGPYRNVRLLGGFGR
jgi:uncharacterized phiE125 gp8 family phage protein